MKKRFGALIIFLSSLMWAADAVFRQPLLKGGLSVGFVAFLEHIYNSILCLPALFRQRARFYGLSKKQWLGLAYIGVGASALGGILFVQGAVDMGYNFTVATLLQKLQPIFAIALAVIFLKEKLNPKFWFMAVPALLGAYLVTFGLASPVNILHSSMGIGLKGPLLAVLAAMLWAGGTVVGRSLLANLDFQFVNGMRFVFGLVFLFLYLAFAGSFQFALMTPFFWRNSLIVALMTGFVALFLYYYGLRSTRASVATLMELGYPLASTVIYWKFLGITLNAWQIIGGLILLASVTLLVLSESKQPAIINQEANLN